MAFNGGDSIPNGILTQTFATTPGQTYQLAFDFGVLSNNNNTQSLQVLVEGATALVSDTVSIQRVGNAAITWDFRGLCFHRQQQHHDPPVHRYLHQHRQHRPAFGQRPGGRAGHAQPGRHLQSVRRRDLTVSPTDTGGIGNGSTGLIRSYNAGTSVTVTAPAVFSGRPFLTWRKYGVNLPGSIPSITLTLTTNQTLDAVFDSLPTATAQSVTGGENQTQAITLAGTDPDGDSLFFALTSVPSHGVLTGAPPNLTYTPAANYQGPDSFTFTAFDGIMDSAPATVSITVHPLDEFNQWLGSFGLTAGAGEDSDQDSISNAVEYVIGGNPANAPDNGLLPTATLVTADPDGDLISTTITCFSPIAGRSRRTRTRRWRRGVEWNTSARRPVEQRHRSAGRGDHHRHLPRTGHRSGQSPHSLLVVHQRILFARLRVAVNSP